MLTLPKLFWIIYGIILFFTLITGVINWIRQRYSALSAITIIFSLLVPIVSFVYTVGRAPGQNEFVYLFSQLQAKDPWALFIFLGYIYLLVWWFFFVRSFNVDRLWHRLHHLFGMIRDWFRSIRSQKDMQKDAKGDKEREKQ